MVPTKTTPPKTSVHKQTDYFITVFTESPVSIPLPVPVRCFLKWQPHSIAKIRKWDFLQVFPLTGSFVAFLHLLHAPKPYHRLMCQLASCLSEIFILNLYEFSYILVRFARRQNSLCLVPRSSTRRQKAQDKRNPGNIM